MASNADQELPLLPPSLTANILSYNLRNLVDVARLRELNQNFGKLAVSLVPSLVPTSGHFLPTSEGTSDFIDYLVRPHTGDWWNPQGRSSTKAYVTALWNRFQTKPVREGVAVVDGLVSANLEQLLNNGIHSLIQKQENEGTVDYHPNSNNVVRDLVHPALYSFVEGISQVADLAPLEPCRFPSLQDSAVASGVQRDFWGRKYEDSKYQWLPTIFSVSQEGACTIEDYINNLTPRESHRDLYDGLAKLFEQCLPFAESVYSYICSIQPHLRQDSDMLDWDPSPLPESRGQHYISLRGQKLQVITKIVDYELQPGQSHQGVWHVEGMSHEEIVLTCLYILDRDDDIQGGNLEFKRAFLDDEADFFFSRLPQDRSHHIDRIVQEGLKPLGTIETIKGRLIVFPNSHVHRVTEMINTGASLARRRIVVFFLVNPLRRIVSTREVAPQQIQSSSVEGASAPKKRQVGGMTLEEAKNHRLTLMKERKFTKQDWNVREIELCEH